MCTEYRTRSVTKRMRMTPPTQDENQPQEKNQADFHEHYTKGVTRGRWLDSVLGLCVPDRVAALKKLETKTPAQAAWVTCMQAASNLDEMLAKLAHCTFLYDECEVSASITWDAKKEARVIEDLSNAICARLSGTLRFVTEEASGKLVLDLTPEDDAEITRLDAAALELTRYIAFCKQQEVSAQQDHDAAKAEMHELWKLWA